MKIVEIKTPDDILIEAEKLANELCEIVYTRPDLNNKLNYELFSQSDYPGMNMHNFFFDGFAVPSLIESVGVK
jgi:hypothetical protein